MRDTCLKCPQRIHVTKTDFYDPVQLSQQNGGHDDLAGFGKHPTAEIGQSM